jgi:hypothetical protein
VSFGCAVGVGVGCGVAGVLSLWCLAVLCGGELFAEVVVVWCVGVVVVFVGGCFVAGMRTVL